MGVDCDFVTEMQRSGVKMRDADDAIELRAIGAFPPAAKPRRAAPPRPVATAVRGGDVAVVDMERGVIEARRSDGRTARKIGRAAGTERGRPAGEISGGAGKLKKKQQ